jgi:predicted nucleotidyltransferase
MDKREAIEKVRAYKSLLKKHIPFEKIYIFGSYAKDTYQDDSDIDVAIVVKKMDGDFFPYIRCSGDYADRLMTALNRFLLKGILMMPGFLKKS